MVAIVPIFLMQNPGTCYSELKMPQFLPVLRSSLSLFSAVVTEHKRLKNLLRKMFSKGLFISWLRTPG